MREPPLVRFTGVSKSYDGVALVVRDLDLDIRRGEFLSLLGPSGSGKTTTLMMLAGFEMPTAGSITLDGRPLDQVPPWRRNIGIVFQSYALFPHMTVAENIAFPLKQRSLPKAEMPGRVAAMLALVRLTGLGDRRPAQLSGGQQQRVALARALVFGPQLVLMDEPLGALDKRLREQMQIELKRIHAELSVTIVYVTHDQGEALAMSDRVAVFSDGRIRQLGTPVELYEQPTDAVVADFVGENNRLEGVAESVAGGVCHVRLPGGALLHARAPRAIASGSRVVLALRPERIVLSQGAAPATAENRGAGVVSGVLYLGDHARVALDLDDGIALVAKIPNDTRLEVPTIGRRVTISWRTTDCIAFELDNPQVQ